MTSSRILMTPSHILMTSYNSRYRKQKY